MHVVSIIAGLYFIVSALGMSVIFNKIESEDKTFPLFIFGLITFPVLYLYEVITDRGDNNE